MADSIFYYDSIDIPDSRLNKFRRVLTSCFMFLSAYIVANLVHHLFLGLLSWIIGYETTVGFHTVSSAPYDYAHWSSLRVLFLYATTPFVCLIAAYIIYMLVLNNTEIISSSRAFFFWLHACFVNVFLTQLFIIPMGTNPRYANGFYRSFAIVTTWFHLPGEVFVVATVLAGLLAILWGYMMAPEIQRYSFSSRLVQTMGGKNKVAIQVYLLPILLGMPAIVWFSNSLSFLLHVLLLSLFFLPWLGIFIRHRMDMSIVRCNKEDVLNHWPILEGVLMAVVWTLAVILFDK